MDYDMVKQWWGYAKQKSGVFALVCLGERGQVKPFESLCIFVCQALWTNTGRAFEVGRFSTGIKSFGFFFTLLTSSTHVNSMLLPLHSIHRAILWALKSVSVFTEY